MNLFFIIFLIRESRAEISSRIAENDCEIISKDGLSCLGELGGDDDEDDLIGFRQGIFTGCKVGYKLDQKRRCRRVVSHRKNT